MPLAIRSSRSLLSICAVALALGVQATPMSALAAATGDGRGAGVEPGPISPTELAVYGVAYRTMSNLIPHGRGATAQSYMRGRIRPELDIAVERGYYPVWGTQNGVRRALRRSGECNWAPNTGAYWDFQVACKSHDYCYDLRRVGGYANVSKRGCDDEFLGAMVQDCEPRGWPARVTCVDLAIRFYLAVSGGGRAADDDRGSDQTGSARVVPSASGRGGTS